MTLKLFAPFLFLPLFYCGVAKADQPPSLTIIRSSVNDPLCIENAQLTFDFLIGVRPIDQFVGSSPNEFALSWTITAHPIVDPANPILTIGPALMFVEGPLDMEDVTDQDGNGVQYVVVRVSTTYDGIVNDAFIADDRYQTVVQLDLIKFNSAGEQELVLSALATGPLFASILNKGPVEERYAEQ